ncbi:hypothetical protein MTR_7g079620 [Medicago truncatula]|uniref:Uncharacterized protein n=1 Tax=Medicago truncatula TaxID=3880 RepID=G7KQM6_MEDTR|nr:hypothetical protein MTR_7g079620 [Medicago truncatula]
MTIGPLIYKVFNLYSFIQCGTYNSHLHTTTLPLKCESIFFIMLPLKRKLLLACIAIYRCCCSLRKRTDCLDRTLLSNGALIPLLGHEGSLRDRPHRGLNNHTSERDTTLSIGSQGELGGPSTSSPVLQFSYFAERFQSKTGVTISLVQNHTWQPIKGAQSSSQYKCESITVGDELKHDHEEDLKFERREKRRRRTDLFSDSSQKISKQNQIEVFRRSCSKSPTKNHRNLLNSGGSAATLGRPATTPEKQASPEKMKIIFLFQIPARMREERERRGRK